MELQVIDEVSNRLDKLEGKIDRLADAVITIARIEERVTTVLKQNDRFIMRLDRLEDRVETVEQTTKLNKKDVSNKELWTELDLLNNEFEISWNWVKAHSTDKLNNEVDLLARDAAYL